MSRITPTYYAAGVANPEYTIEGLGFGLIPEDAVGIAAGSNDDPTRSINTTYAGNLYEITDRGAGTMRLTQIDHNAHGSDTYLGCIVSADRQTIFWINNTRPLP